MKYRVTVKWMSREDYIVTADSSAEFGRRLAAFGGHDG